MMLYVRGTDIRSLTLGILKDDRSAFLGDLEVFVTTPEEYFGNIAAFLAVHTETPLSGIVAVLGPGSATALRTSLTLVNTLGFAKSIPVYGISLSPDADDRAALVALHGASPIPMARPIYQHEARITPSVKDSLNRR